MPRTSWRFTRAMDVAPKRHRLPEGSGNLITEALAAAIDTELNQFPREPDLLEKPSLSRSMY